MLFIMFHNSWVTIFFAGENAPISKTIFKVILIKLYQSLDKTLPILKKL